MSYIFKLVVCLCLGVFFAMSLAWGLSLEAEELDYQVNPRYTDVYDIRMWVYMPRIYDNTKSLGYRKYQRQLIVGKMYVDYSEGDATITFSQFTNKTYKINGNNVTYVCRLNTDMPSCLSLIGDNKKNEFKKTSVAFFCELNPSYNIGEDEPDNTLVLGFGGKGLTTVWKRTRVAYSVSGNVAGTMGCGCMDYGHKSPTRNWGYCGPGDVTDIAATHGRFTMRLNKAESRR